MVTGDLPTLLLWYRLSNDTQLSTVYYDTQWSTVRLVREQHTLADRLRLVESMSVTRLMLLCKSVC